MKHKFLLIYTWFVRSITFFLPDAPILMRFRGYLYSFGMKKCGSNFQVSHSVIINTLEGLSVGNNVYVANFTVILSKHIQLEDDVLIGPSCVFSSSNHILENGSFRNLSESGKEVIIGSGSWVAANCTILSGAVLPKGSVLAANSALTSKLDCNLPLSIYGGNPAKFIKQIVHKTYN